MARKKGGFSRFVGGLTGTPYERLVRHIDKVSKEEDERELARELNKAAKIVRREYDEGSIDEQEHDLLIEDIETVHPTGKTFPKFDTDADEFYDADNMPDAPEPELGGPVNLDELMRSRNDSFQGSWGTDEYDDYKRQMAEEFYRESDEAIAAGDHQNLSAQDPVGGRVFHDVEDDAEETRRAIAQEQGLVDDTVEEGEDEDYYVDDDGVEWWRDDDGQWWYRLEGQQDWYQSDD